MPLRRLLIKHMLEFFYLYNGMYGSSNVVLGISSSSLLWELALVDNKSVFLIS